MKSFPNQGTTDMIATIQPITYTDWEKRIRNLYPSAQFTVEDGTGKTYGTKGSCTAHTGPDMQADVVGVFSPENDYANLIDDKTIEFTTPSFTVEEQIDDVLQEWAEAASDDEVTDLRVKRVLAIFGMIERVEGTTLRLHTDEGVRYCVIEEADGEVSSIGLSEEDKATPMPPYPPERVGPVKPINLADLKPMEQPSDNKGMRILLDPKNCTVYLEDETHVPGKWLGRHHIRSPEAFLLAQILLELRIANQRGGHPQFTQPLHAMRAPLEIIEPPEKGNYRPSTRQSDT